MMGSGTSGDEDGGVDAGDFSSEKMGISDRFSEGGLLHILPLSRLTVMSSRSSESSLLGTTRLRLMD